jgi:hypothetical protein
MSRTAFVWADVNNSMRLNKTLDSASCKSYISSIDNSSNNDFQHLGQEDLFGCERIAYTAATKRSYNYSNS